MINIINKKNCCGCAACMNVCPNECITMMKDQEGFYYPTVDLSRCIQCGRCNAVCPFQVNTNGRIKTPQVYGVNAHDMEIRYHSSSGGAFTLLAEEILNQQGVVYGVTLNKEKLSEPVFVAVRKMSDLRDIRGSKYVQASTNDVYSRVKNDLSNGEKVLFSGTPCQINALKNYLQREYSNLTCIELICHGVPSQLLLEKFIANLEKTYASKVVAINFRSKAIPYERVKKYKNTIKIHMPKEECPYLTMFLKDYALRPSCYDCIAKKNESQADLTLADLWGVAQIAPSLDDGYGTSAVIVQSEKGRLLLQSVLERADYYEVNFDDAIRKHNNSYFADVPMPKERRYFYEDLNCISFRRMENKYIKRTRINRMKLAIKNTPLYSVVTHIKRKNMAPSNQGGGYAFYALLQRNNP